MAWSNDSCENQSDFLEAAMFFNELWLVSLKWMKTIFFFKVLARNLRLVMYGNILEHVKIESIILESLLIRISLRACFENSLNQ